MIAHVASLRIVGRALAGGVAGQPVLVMSVNDVAPTVGEWIRTSREPGRKGTCREIRFHRASFAAGIARTQAGDEHPRDVGG